MVHSTELARISFANFDFGWREFLITRRYLLLCKIIWSLRNIYCSFSTENFSLLVSEISHIFKSLKQHRKNVMEKKASACKKKSLLRGKRIIGSHDIFCWSNNEKTLRCAFWITAILSNLNFGFLIRDVTSLNKTNLDDPEGRHRAHCRNCLLCSPSRKQNVSFASCFSVPRYF